MTHDFICIYPSGSIAYLAELMHLLGKSHGAVKYDIQNKILLYGHIF